jgi:hypothetical protein
MWMNPSTGTVALPRYTTVAHIFELHSIYALARALRFKSGIGGPGNRRRPVVFLFEQ